MPASPELLHRLAMTSEENHAQQVLKSCAIARMYPSGHVPPLGVTFCRDWLRYGCDEDGFELHLLDLVEVHDNDQEWSLNGVPQGGWWNLVKFIVGDLPREEMGWVLTDLHADYDEMVGMAKAAVQRRAALGIP